MLAILALVRWQNLYKNSDKARMVLSELDLTEERPVSPLSEAKKTEAKKDKLNEKKKEKPKNTSKLKDIPGYASPSPQRNLRDQSKSVKRL
ncbi:hypothetical protein HK103_002718 [Boothiomyces macroporosus]|uniref:Uncharacterized protein n=1 Tax=Boothiomyces macroporosus TaxID=261099 RepID=A0AAD5Y731_9FUNG|nr:hypothetical protein HK103_002718 [Boothiomyces macroporosus]